MPKSGLPISTCISAQTAANSSGVFTAAIRASIGSIGFRPRALMAATSMAAANMSPTFWVLEPGAPGLAAAASTRARTWPQLRSASSSNPPQRDLSEGMVVRAYQPPAENFAKSAPGATAGSMCFTLKPGPGSAASAARTGARVAARRGMSLRVRMVGIS